MTCLLCHKLLVLHPQSHHTPTKLSEPHLEVCWSIGHFICSSLILSGKCLLCCKSNSRFTRLLITLPDDLPRLTHVWNRTCLCPLCIQIISSCDFPIWTLFFLKKNTLFGLHYHVASFRNLHLVVGLVSIWKRKAIAESQPLSLNTHFFAYLMYLSCFIEQSVFLGGSCSNEGSHLPSENHPSCHVLSHAATLDGDDC